MPLQATSGAASYDAFGGGVAAVPNYIEEVFSTYLYTGTGANQSIVNGVDLSGKGGLVWIKDRAASNHLLMTTDGGPTNRLRSNGQPSYVTSTAGRDLSSFNSNGFSLGIDEQSSINTSGEKYVSWSFRKQPKFFDVVTWTGNGTNRTIPHNLGSVPGCIIIGTTSAIGADWSVYHSGLANTEYLTLNSTVAKGTDATYWNSTTATSSVFSLGTSFQVNYNTGTYIAYVFASNAGGFGLTGTDNVISCGSFTTDGSGKATVTLGYEAQWVLFKPTDNNTQDWRIVDSMRGFTVDGQPDAFLYPNLSSSEGLGNSLVFPTATGFGVNGLVDTTTWIYIAIRRGPMKVPTDATKVFTPVLNSNFTAGVVIAGQPTVDASWSKGTGNNQMRIFDRLRGSVASSNRTLYPDSTGTEGDEPYWALDQQNGVRITATLGTLSYVNYFFSRAPSYFDEVCYTGSGFARVNHNLQTRPELILVKSRSASGGWAGVQLLPDASDGWNKLSLQTTDAGITVSSQTGSLSSWMRTNDFMPGYVYRSDGTTPTASGVTYVAYLFATCAGVSKVGSYTGTGSLQTVNCGFTSGARFILIKRTDSTGDWYLYNSASGITSSDDPYFLLNSSAAQVTGTNYVDTDSTGFKVTAAAPAGLNASGGTYIFLAIA